MSLDLLDARQDKLISAFGSGRDIAGIARVELTTLHCPTLMVLHKQNL